MEDARFCHRCARPVDGIEPMPQPEPEPAEAQVEAQVPPEIAAIEALAAAQTTAISFHNGTAVRVALRAALLTFLVELLTMQLGAFAPLQFMLSLVITAAGGFYSVYLYQRRTGASLTARNGARLGWIAGVFFFVIYFVLLTIGMLGVSEQGGFAKIMRENSGVQLSPEVLNQMDEILSSPATLTTLILFIVLFLFMTFTVAASLGGMLGAKVLEKE